MQWDFSYLNFMKATFLSFFLALSAVCHAQQVRYMQEIYFEDPEYAFLDRPGSELADILIQAAISGDLKSYRMHSYGSIEETTLELHNGKVVIRHQPDYATEDIGWRSDAIYYFDDEVYADGLVYKAIGNDFEGEPVTNTDYWTISDASLVNPRELELARIDYTTNGSNIVFNYLHFWFVDNFHSEDYYFLSLKISECEAYLKDKPWVLYRESDVTTGHVVGDVFVSDPILNQNRQLARAVMNSSEFTASQEALSDEVAVNHHTGQVFDLTDGSTVLVGSGPLPTPGSFNGFYAMADFARLIPLDRPEKIAVDGQFVDGDVFFDPEAPEVDTDPLSTGALQGTSSDAAVLPGPFLITEAVEYDLEYPGNPDLLQPGKEIARLLVEAVKKGKAGKLYKDALMQDPINRESFEAELAVRDWEMEEEYGNIPFWDDRESYEQFDRVRVSDTVYISEADFNHGNDPENFGGGFWKIDKILSNTETYKYEEFNKVQLVFHREISAEGTFQERTLVGIQPVVGTAYSIEDNPVTPGYIAFDEVRSLLTPETDVDGQKLRYAQVFEQELLEGYLVFAGFIRKK